jgi:2-keto-3-deoxy-L-fuconate dehydrogenase
MPGRLQGKRAFITAAGQGIGAAIADMFSAEGAEVVATDLEVDKLKQRKTDKIFALDARSTEAVNALGEKVIDSYGAPHILVNCAGYVHQGTVLDCSEKDWDFSFDLNVKSMHRTIQAFLPGMLAKGKGSIINIASTVGANKTAPNRYVYSATKAAVVGLSRSVAMDFIGKGIRCNCICPGTIETPSLGDRIKALGKQVGGEEEARKMFIDRQPMGRLGRAEEMAYVAVYLASDESDYMTGSCIQPDGGFTL